MSGRCFGIIGLLLFIISAGILVCSLQAQDRATSTAVAASQSVDPNKEPSEFNHHMAGFALIGVGILVLTGLIFPQLRPVPFIWPLLFILAGLFLAAWSDGEIWPRGNLSWAFLLHHDPEARQHKIYATLLIALGVLEYLRARGYLGRVWHTWGFPILAICGAGLLLIHDHSAGSGARSQEAKAYLVNPALDVGGKPWPAITPYDPPAAALSQHEGAPNMSEAMDHSKMNMDHSSMAMNNVGIPTNDSHATNHVHHMSPSMKLVEREHFWFMVVGVTIAVFKFLSDAALQNRRFIPYFWPSATALLGVLLTFYRE